MNDSEAKDCLILLNSLFPGRTPIEIGKSFARDLKPFAYATARETIEKHRLTQPSNNGYAPTPSLPAIFESLRAADREGREAARAERREIKEDSWFDMRRRLTHNPSGSIKRAGEVEVSLRVFWMEWKRGRDRVLVQRECDNRLAEAAVSDADERAKLIEYLPSDEGHFRDVVLPFIRRVYPTKADVDARDNAQQLLAV